MAYGLLAGTEPVNGLYCDLVGPWAYGIFGSSPQISVGTFSIIAIMSSIALSKFDDRCVNYDCLVRTSTLHAGWPPAVRHAGSQHGRKNDARSTWQCQSGPNVKTV